MREGVGALYTPLRGHLGVAVALGLAVLPAMEIAGAGVTAPASWVAMTDDLPRSLNAGCDSVTLYESVSWGVAARGEYRKSPGQLSATADGRLFVALSANGGPFLYLFRDLSGTSDWETVIVEDTRRPPKWSEGGGIAISPNDLTVLVAIDNGVEMYDTADIRSGVVSRVLGDVMFDVSVSGPELYPTIAADIVWSADSRTAYIVATDGRIYTLDAQGFVWSGDPVAYAPPARAKGARVRGTYASLSPNERYLVINTGLENTGHLNVVDLRRGTSRLVRAPGLDESWGIAHSFVGESFGLMAVHGRMKVHVFDMRDPYFPTELIAAQVPGQRLGAVPPDIVRLGAVAWNGSGDALIAAVAIGEQEWRVLRFVPGVMSPGLVLMGDRDSCTWPDPDVLEPFDVLTLNDRLSRPTLTPTLDPSATATASKTATEEPTRNATATATPVPSASATSTSRTPAPLYLPLLLKERCTPETSYADTILVVDASTSMLEEVRRDYTKRDAAIEAAGRFVDLLKTGDQAGVVWFNETAGVDQELTGSKAALLSALDGIENRQYTRIDLGIRVAREELATGRHVPDNQPVIILLTDGKSNPEPIDAAVEEAVIAKDAGATLFVIGLGKPEDLDDEALRLIATRPEYYFQTSDAAALASIYEEIAGVIPCPPERFWGRRTLRRLQTHAFP